MRARARVGVSVIAAACALTAAFGAADRLDPTARVPAKLTVTQWADELANGSCLIEYPPESVRARLKTSAQLDYIYSYYLDELVPCMRSLGVDVGEVSARARFHVMSMNGLTLWSPYSAIRPGVAAVKPVGSADRPTLDSVNPGSTSPRMQALLDRCPSLPPGV